MQQPIKIAGWTREDVSYDKRAGTVSVPLALSAEPDELWFDEFKRAVVSVNLTAKEIAAGGKEITLTLPPNGDYAHRISLAEQCVEKANLAIAKKHKEVSDFRESFLPLLDGIDAYLSRAKP